MCDTAVVTESPAHRDRARGPCAITGARWTVTTWNLQGSTGVDHAAVAAVLADAAPDVVAVQEIRRGDARRLALAMSDVASSVHVSWARKHYPYTFLIWWRAEGMAILTRHTLERADSIEISMRMARRWDWRRRIAQWAVVRRGDGEELFVVNVHLSPHALAGERVAEARGVRELAERHGSEVPLVIAGDFNDAADPTVIAELPGIEHVAPGFTNPASAPTQTLDHVLLPEAATEVEVRVPAGGPTWAALSDHVPVTVRFRLPGADTPPS